jgi:flagellar motor switch protein FliN/FliY
VADDLNDFLNPDEIEALLNPSEDPPPGPIGSAPPVSSAGAPGKPKAESEAGFLDPSDIDLLLKPRNVGGESTRHSQEPALDIKPDQTLEEAQSHLDHAMAASILMPDPVAKFGNPTPFSLESFASRQTPAKTRQPLDILQDVELDLRIEFGRTEMLIEEVVALKEGSVVALDKLAGDPVDILVNGRLIARGEVLVLNDNFCVRVAEILTPDG